MGTTAFSILIQECAKHLAHGQWPVVSTSTANGSTTLISDTALRDTRSDASLARFEDTWVRTFIATTENARKVLSFAPNTNSTGEITVQTMTGNHATNTSYEFHYFMHPTDLKDLCINKALRNMSYSVYYPLGLLTNPDMEDADITTDWSEKASDKPANAAETTAANVYRGKQSLKVTDSNVGNEYAYQAFYVIAGKPMYLFAFGKTSAAATSAQVIPYNVTGSAAIETWDFDDQDWQELGGAFTVPAACKQCQVRLNIVTAAGVAYFDDVQCYRADQKEFVLPSWITDQTQIGHVYYLPEGSPGPDDGHMVHETSLRYLDTPKILGSSGRFKIQFSGASIGRPLYLACSRPYAELSTDAETTTADKDTVVEGALFYAYSLKGPDYVKQAAEHGYKWVSRRRVIEPDFGVRLANAYL